MIKNSAKIEEGSLLESSYQKRPSQGEHANNNNDDETSFDHDLLHRDESSNAPHRRKTATQTQKPSYNRHLSFEAFFSGDDKYEMHNGSHFRFRKQAICALLLGLGFIVLILAVSWNGSPATNSPSDDYDDHHQVILPDDSDMDVCDDPIAALEPTCTIKNMQGAVASDMEICSNVGNNILQYENGNAVDAAVATTLCLGVVNPASSGIGGGAMILIHSNLHTHKAKVNHEQYVSPPFHDARVVDAADKVDASEKVTEFIDCREEAPAGASKNMFKAPGASSEVGGLAIAVPAELRGLELAHARHGTLSWAKVVEPAMVLARDGFVVSPYLAHEVKINTKKMEPFPELWNAFSIRDKNGSTRLVREGDMLKLPKLAKTLEAIMNGGADVMYKGEMGERIAKDIQEAGGIITADDLSEYKPVLRSPLVARNVHGINLVGIGPPSSGGAAIVGAARFLSGYKNPYAYLADTLSKHRLVESLKHVFAIRMSLSDPAFNQNTTASAVADMVQGTYMEKLRRLTHDDGELPMSRYGGPKWAKLNDGDGQNGTAEMRDANEGDRRQLLLPDEARRRRELRHFGYLHDHGTTHLSVVDKDRNAVAITSTVNTYFGSIVMSPSTGIVFNNQMDDFATPGKLNYFGLHPSKANYISPKKRPLSSMSPTMVFRSTDSDSEEDDEESRDENDLGSLLLVLGASGGPKIISAVVQVILNYAWLGMPLYEAVASPRLHDQLLYHGRAVTTWEREPLVAQTDKNISVVISIETLAALKKRGHTLLPVDYMGTVQAVAVDMETNTLQAVSDIRKGGKPAGY